MAARSSARRNLLPDLDSASGVENEHSEEEEEEEEAVVAVHL